MLKRLLQCVREYKTASILSMVFIVLEAVIEAFIPFITADLINSIDGDIPKRRLPVQNSLSPQKKMRCGSPGLTVVMCRCFTCGYRSTF